MKDICANSWATKIEYLPTRASQVTYSPLREWHRNKPEIRDKLTQSVQGRGRFGHQVLSPDVVVRGTGIYRRGRSVTGGDEAAVVGMANKQEAELFKMRDVGSKRYYTTHGNTRPRNEVRPRTSLGIGSSMKLDTNNSTGNFKDLVEVYSFRAEGKIMKVKKINQDRPEEIKTMRVPSINNEPDPETAMADNISPRRVMSVPVTSQQTDGNAETFDRKELLTPSLWTSSDSKSGYRSEPRPVYRPDSKISVTKAIEKWSPKRPSLRSLLSETHASQHSKECPYKCRNCFRACLVSDNYVPPNSRNNTAD